MSKRKILVVSANYYPEPAGVAPLCTELCEDLVQQGFDVTVLTAFPSYPERVVKEPYRGKVFLREEIRGVKLIRTWMHVKPDPGRFWRAFSFSTFILTSLFGACFAGRPDTIVCLSSPMPVGFAAWLISRWKHCPYLYNAQDLLIEASLQAGYIRPGWWLRRMLAFERIILHGARQVTVIGENFKDNMLAKGVPEERVTVIPNWIDLDFVKPASRMNRFREESGLGERFVLMHAGNIGLIHGHEYVIEAAERTKDQPEITYVYLGSGLMKPRLEKMVQEKQLDNVRFLPLRPREEMPLFLPAADCHLVSLDRGMKYSLPSKLATVMAAGRPVIGMMDEETDAARIIRSAGCGVVVPPREPERLADAVRRMYAAPAERERMGQAGRRYAEAHFDRRKNTEQYRQLLSRMIE